MKTLIVCTSLHHGNTEKIAAAMAAELKCRVVHAKETNHSQLKEYDLIGFGSGIYFWRHHKSLFDLLGEFHHPQHGKRAFIFSTSGAPFGRLYHGALRRLLRKKGFKIAGEFSCRGFDTVGPLARIGGIAKGHPDGRDISAAGEFARKLHSPSMP